VKKAVYLTQNGNVEVASNWIFEHMDDADIDQPLNIGNKAEASENSEAVVILTSMGFSEQQANRALKATDNNLERATEWIFNHMDDMEEETKPLISENTANAIESGMSDGKADYSLVGFVTHIGTSAQSGHYVCHIKKDGKWIYYNDTKVQLSENVPRDLGYMYIFKRQ